MCKYCDMTHDKIPVIDCDMDLGVLGNTVMSFYIEVHKNVSFLVMTINNYGLGGRTYSQYYPIDYCPMCGRELNKGGDKQ